ncbi:MAG TPA: GNAT family N-acetyltransferase [Pseudonocardia sp.]|nr:GNAT family N-acetyltransferase [Pseudonocardia sp.]
MIRPITSDDTPAVVSLAVSSGLFAPDDAEFIEQMMADYFGSKGDDGHMCVIDEEDEPLAVAYYEPARAADRTWYLTMIAVRGDRQGRGHGAALMRYVEEDLRARGQRLLLVETSGVPGFERTRAFYAKLGYEQEARVRDYYEPGDDMILFRKALPV